MFVKNYAGLALVIIYKLGQLLYPNPAMFNNFPIKLSPMDHKLSQLIYIS